MPVYPGHTESIIADRPDCPRNMGAMTVVVDRVGGFINKIPSPDVINIPIPIIIDAIPRNFIGIIPDICGEISYGYTEYRYRSRQQQHCLTR